MPEPKMNPDEVDIDAPLVARLVATQFPQWGDLPLAEVRSAGTDNTIYRLGGGLAVRLPRHPGAVAEVARQQRWLPRLAPLLPLAAVIDFGGLGVGDPAIDLLPAWAWLTARTRHLFGAQTGASDATWARGRGWALGLGLGAIHYYRHTNPALAAIGQHAAAEATADYQPTA
jgi:aminoglycoside phosphotransferase (APT) family kinase protein